jgi:hypothetical protein
LPVAESVPGRYTAFVENVGTPDGKGTARAKAFADISLVSGTLFVLLRFSWMKWPDVLIDFGRELYVPWLIAEGNVLYRDVLYFASPLSPYWNALWFRLFGPGLSVIVWVNIGLLFLLLLAMYRVMRYAATPFAATLACLMFVSLFAVGRYTLIGNYNYVTPYSHEATHGMLLSWVAIACQLAHLRSGRLPWLVGAGISLGFVFLTKPEFLIAAAAASLTAVSCWAWRSDADRKTVLRRGILFGASFLVPPLAACALLASRLSWPEAAVGVLGSWWYIFDERIAALPFYRKIIGVSDLRHNLGRMLYTLGLYLAVFAPAAALARASRERRTAVLVAVSGSSVLFAAMFLFRARLPWEELARPLPVITLAAGVAILREVIRHREEKDISSLVLVVFSFLLQLKMILNARIAHYGFVLVMPAMMVMVLALVDWIPGAIRIKGGQPLVFQAISLAFLAAVAALHLSWSAMVYRTQTVPVGEGADAFVADSRGRDVNAAIEWLKRNTHPSDTVAVFPEGAILNYLSRRFNSTPVLTLMPPEILMFGGRRLLVLLQDAPPDYIVLVHRDTGEYGYRFFGRDYG